MKTFWVRSLLFVPKERKTVAVTGVSFIYLFTVSILEIVNSTVLCDSILHDHEREMVFGVYSKDGKLSFFASQYLFDSLL